jgi:hypothetical protein
LSKAENVLSESAPFIGIITGNYNSPINDARRYLLLFFICRTGDADAIPLPEVEGVMGHHKSGCWMRQERKKQIPARIRVAGQENIEHLSSNGGRGAGLRPRWQEQVSQRRLRPVGQFATWVNLCQASKDQCGLAEIGI